MKNTFFIIAIVSSIIFIIISIDSLRTLRNNKHRISQLEYKVEHLTKQIEQEPIETNKI